MLKASTNRLIHDTIATSSIALAALVIVSSIAIISYKSPQVPYGISQTTVIPKLNEGDSDSFIHNTPETVPVHFIEFPVVYITLTSGNNIDELGLNKQHH
jgi:hypothetical protein